MLDVEVEDAGTAITIERAKLEVQGFRIAGSEIGVHLVGTLPSLLQNGTFEQLPLGIQVTEGDPPALINARFVETDDAIRCDGC
jgi:hypothetical protein